MNFFPYSDIRPIQDQLVKDVKLALETNQNLIAHAPTGLGKTAATLAPALEKATENNLTVFFLTPKHTQHQIAIETLRLIKEKHKLDFTTVDFIGRRWMCSVPGVNTMTSHEFQEYCKNQRANGLCIPYKNTWYTKKDHKQMSGSASNLLLSLKNKSPQHVENFIGDCVNEDLCPYELASLLAKKAKVIIGDYYHLFSPSIREAFLLRIDKELEKSIVIVDEAHNLPDRLRNVLSTKLTTISINFAKKEAKRYGFDDMISLIDALHDVLHELSKEFLDKEFTWAKTARDEKESYVSKHDFVKKLEKTLGTEYEQFLEDLENSAKEIRKQTKKSSCGGLASFLESWKGQDEGFSRIIKKATDKTGKIILSLEYDCLDPSLLSKDVVDTAPSVIAMSGTLVPTFMYRDLLGFDKRRTIEKEYSSPFPPQNRLSLINTEVTTKYSSRSIEEYKKIAKECSGIASVVPHNVALFFPSYYMMSQILPFFSNGKAIFTEKPDLTKEEKASLLSAFKESADRGAVLAGVQGGSFSISGDEEIMIEKDGITQLREIGPLLDSYFEKYPHKIKRIATNDTALLSVDGLCVPSMNSDFKLEIKPVKQLIRHRTTEALYRICSETNREVKTTGEHSVLALKNGKIMSEKVSNLKEGDFLLAPKQLPIKYSATRIDLVKELLLLSSDLIKNIYVRGVNDSLASGTKLKEFNLPRFWKHRATLPINFLRIKDLWVNEPSPEKIHVRWGIEIPPILKLDELFFKLLGYYVAEGHCSSGRHASAFLTFGTHEKPIYADAIRLIKKVFGRTARAMLNPASESAVQIQFGGKLAYLLFTHILAAGKNAHTKRIPSVVFSASKTAKLAFLSGYFAGDGTASKHIEISFKTVSKGLASDLLYLLSQLGVVATATKILPKDKTHSLAYQIIVTNIDQLKPLLPILRERDKATVLNHIKTKQNWLRRKSHIHKTIPIKESGLLDLWTVANPRKPRVSRSLTTRLNQARIGPEKLKEILDYLEKHARGQIDSHRLNFLKKLANSDLAFVKVKKIDRCASPSEYVYDVSVEGNENFVGGFGGIILHNSEGVDLPGNQLQAVVLVGVPLGHPDLKTKALIDYYDKKYGKGWDYGYLFPAISRSLQAAGRCIRSETDRGVVVFMDKRFGWSSYLQCIPKEWTPMITKLASQRVKRFFTQTN